jgi:hypothetical protein
MNLTIKSSFKKTIRIAMSGCSLIAGVAVALALQAVLGSIIQ